MVVKSMSIIAESFCLVCTVKYSTVELPRYDVELWKKLLGVNKFDLRALKVPDPVLIRYSKPILLD